MPAAPEHPLVRSFLRNAGWATTTTSQATSCLNRWTRWLDEHDAELTAATREHCQTYLDARLEVAAPATVQVDWRMLKALHRWLYDEGETDADPMRRIKAPRVAETPVKVVTEAEYSKVLATCDRRTINGRRDEAILSLLWWSGLRRSEIVNLDLASLDADARAITVGSRTFATKSRKVRRVPVAGDTLAALDRYLRRRGYEAGPLFLSQHGDDHDARRLEPNALSMMLRRRCAAAGIGRTIGAHEFRRAMAQRHKRAGGSDPALMAIAGWSSIRMVDRYTRMEREDLAAAEFHRLIDTSRTSARRRGRRVS